MKLSTRLSFITYIFHYPAVLRDISNHPAVLHISHQPAVLHDISYHPAVLHISRQPAVFHDIPTNLLPFMIILENFLLWVKFPTNLLFIMWLLIIMHEISYHSLSLKRLSIKLPLKKLLTIFTGTISGKNSFIHYFLTIILELQFIISGTCNEIWNKMLLLCHQTIPDLVNPSQLNILLHWLTEWCRTTKQCCHLSVSMAQERGSNTLCVTWWTKSNMRVNNYWII